MAKEELDGKIGEEAGGKPAGTAGEEKGTESQGGADKGADGGADGVTDSHGQPGINKERHDKEVAALNQRIAELESQVAEAAETKEGREKLEKAMADLKAEMADKDTAHKLEMAGCVDLKAAKARLGDFDGDVAKLKSECPYLFGKEKQQAGSTGKPPAGASSGIDEKLDRAFGLK
ncbi:hypothetical protein [Parvibacter caecicola]|uniref:hypothetical protein n=1 Tax=Parvibacter caecicola TaxID=747645 RepID=UPI0027315406|nr:hypothetical protein [Parvibacter caecicola]